MFILKSASSSAVGASSRSRQIGNVPAKSIYDIAPTVLKEFGINIPEAMQGHPIF